MPVPFLGADCFVRGRHNGVCLLHWRGMHLETEAPFLLALRPAARREPQPTNGRRQGRRVARHAGLRLPLAPAVTFRAWLYLRPPPSARGTAHPNWNILNDPAPGMRTDADEFRPVAANRSPGAHPILAGHANLACPLAPAALLVVLRTGFLVVAICKHACKLFILACIVGAGSQQFAQSPRAGQV